MPHRRRCSPLSALTPTPTLTLGTRRDRLGEEESDRLQRELQLEARARVAHESKTTRELEAYKSELDLKNQELPYKVQQAAATKEREWSEKMKNGLQMIGIRQLRARFPPSRVI